MMQINMPSQSLVLVKQADIGSSTGQRDTHEITGVKRRVSSSSES